MIDPNDRVRGTMNRRWLRLWPIVLLVIAASVAIILKAQRRPQSAEQSQAESLATVAPTIEASGEILGVAIGSTFEEVRAKLDALRDPGSDPIREKNEPEERKTYWKLAHPEYSWIMVRPNRQGRITQISAFLKPDTPKSFDQVGDLKRAATNADNMAVWNVDRPNDLSYRLVAKGANGRATNVILIATSPE